MASAYCFKMARLIAIAQIIVAGLLFALGIGDVVVQRLFFTGDVGFGIWNGAWLAVTGGLGIPGTSRERTFRTNVFAGVYMGFSITSAVFAGISISCYSLVLAFLGDDYYEWYGPYQAPFALAVVILILSFANFVLGIWAAVCSCFIATCKCCAPSGQQDAQMVYMANPGMPAGGYVIGQSPGAVPVAVPAQGGGGAGMVAVQVPTSTVMGQQTLSHNPQVPYVPVSAQMVPAGVMGDPPQYVE